jgi:hypothetical protein
MDHAQSTNGVVILGAALVSERFMETEQCDGHRARVNKSGFKTFRSWHELAAMPGTTFNG